MEGGVIGVGSVTGTRPGKRSIFQCGVYFPNSADSAKSLPYLFIFVGRTAQIFPALLYRL